MVLDIETYEKAVQRAISRAKREYGEEQLLKEKSNRIKQVIKERSEALSGLLGRIETALKEYKLATSSVAIKTLTDLRVEIKKEIKDIDFVAVEIVDTEFLDREEELFREQEEQEANRWRLDLKNDLLEMLDDCNNYFAATDSALTIKGYLEDLEAIGATGEVADALVDKINALSSKGDVAKRRQTDADTILFIASIAMNNRSSKGGSSFSEPQPQSRHRGEMVSRPDPYKDLSGTVVIAGGHEKLQRHVANRLAHSDVTLYWSPVDANAKTATQVAEHVNSADLILVLSSYASKQSTASVEKAAKAAGHEVVYITTTGTTRLMEAIAVGLGTQQLTQKFAKRA